MIGSSDLEYIVNELQNHGKLVGITEDNRSVIEPQNKGEAARYLKAVIAARLFVFRVFLETARDQPWGITEAHKRLWLFIQIDPEYYLGSDVFRTLTETIINTDLQASRVILSERSRIEQILGPAVIFSALDETQMLINKSQDFFCSEQDPTQPRPILRALFPLFLTCKPLIMSGTSLSMRDVTDIYGSVVAKDGPDVVTFTELGAFETQEDQRLYLEHYLPEDVLSPELAGRIGYWLHGRLALRQSINA
jgi:hypothetical protein